MEKFTKINKSKIAVKAGISKAMVCQIFSGKKRAGWRSAKKLAEITQTDPIIWLEGTPDEIKQAILNGDPDYDRLAQKANAIVAAEVTRVVSDIRNAALNG